jgi:hypothetical protein
MVENTSWYCKSSLVRLNRNMFIAIYQKADIVKLQLVRKVIVSPSSITM